jgi:hypothetical protein
LDWFAKKPTTCYGVFLEKLFTAQSIKKFSALMEPGGFIILLTKAAIVSYFQPVLISHTPFEISGCLPSFNVP